MKQKGINKLIYCLIPLMFLFFSLSILFATVKPATADTVNPYPFKRGVNAYRDTWELTIPDLTDKPYVDVLYKPDIATSANPRFPTLSKDGYLVLHMQTDTAVTMFFQLWEYGSNAYINMTGTPRFMDESGNVTTLAINDYLITVPAYSRGAMILPLSSVQGIDLSKIEFFDACVNKDAAYAKLWFGTLGYYENASAKEMHALTTAEPASEWKIQSNVSGIDLEQLDISFKTGVNALSYGLNVTYTATDWRQIWFAPDKNGEGQSVFSIAKQEGFFAVQMEAANEAYLAPFLFNNNGEVMLFCDGTAYFMNDIGDTMTLTAYEGHYTIPKGSKGFLIMPLASFNVAALAEKGQTFDWNHIDLFVLAADGGEDSPYANKELNVSVGELGYYPSHYAHVIKVVSLNSSEDSSKITTNAPGASYIGYVNNDMKEGDNVFAYGASWSGIKQTQVEAWSSMSIALDNTVALDKENGVLAIHMEIIYGGKFSFLPAVWDGSDAHSASYSMGSATFIDQSGVATDYDVIVIEERPYLQLPSCKGVLLLNLSEFENNGNDWNAITMAIITVNTTNTYNFTLNVGEIGYYANTNAALQKLVSLETIADYEPNKYLSFDTSAHNDANIGTIIRIGNQNVVPTAHYVSLSATDSIAMTFFVELPNNSNQTQVGTFTMDGAAGYVEVTGFYKKENGCFAYTVYVAPKDYKKNVTLTIGDTTVIVTNVETYANKYISQGATQAVKDMATAMKAYCEAARAYFEGDVVENKISFTTDLSAYQAKKTENTGDVTIQGAALDVGANTWIKIRFTTAKPINQIEVKGAVVTKVDGEENVYDATIQYIVAKRLNDTYTITIGEDVVTYSVLSYVHAIVTDNTQSAALHNLVVALYNYHVQAKAFFA